ncbi:MAG: Fe-S cluster assembly protein SufD, partial [Paracoccaceae bacterium]
KSKPDLVEARVSGMRMPPGSAWATKARADALQRLRDMGMPSRRDEYWKYTDPTTLSQNTPVGAKVFDAKEPEMFADIDRLKIVFVDGVFDEEASDDLTLAGIEIERLSDVMMRDIHWAKDFYGVLEARGQSPVARSFAALNSAFATDGVVIRVTGKAANPVSLVYLHQSENSDAILHNLIRIEAGAELTLLENGPAAARFSNVLEVDIADRGAFRHIRTQGRDHERQTLTHIFTRLGSESLFKSFTLNANGVLTRNEVVIELTGDNAIAHVAGAAVGDGDFHHDDTIFITHDALECESRQVFKKVLRNGAKGVFQGKILVKAGAQKTDGYQISQALLLDEDAQFLAKPELEIYADDVICSHGSTTGAIDEEAMYYMRSRGIPKSKAQDLLVLAFLAQAIEEIDDQEIATELTSRLDSWLVRHRSK